MLARVKRDLVEVGQYGRHPARKVCEYEQVDSASGVTRPSGSQADKEARDYAVARMKEANLDVRIDPVGNIIARKNGTSAGARSVMCGSHLDSVKNGGQFDGAVGVFGAIEAVRRLRDEGFQNERPIDIVVFTDEEGSAFGMTLLGSAAFTGKITVSEALERRNDHGETLDKALRQIGYSGTDLIGPDSVEYFVELHIEQGPVLSSRNVPIGIVENIAGIRWVNLTILGQANHAGSTPMHLRRDALVAASEIVQFVNRYAKELVSSAGSSTVGTVGRLTVFPNGTNVIPGRVEMGIDIRDTNSDIMDLFQRDLFGFCKSLEVNAGVTIEASAPLNHPPMPLSPEVVSIIEQAASKSGVESIKMNSGAVHDSQNMASRVKTGMIFIPSVNSVSHSPMEWTNWEDVERGVQVLTQTLKELSRA